MPSTPDNAPPVDPVQGSSRNVLVEFTQPSANGASYRCVFSQPFDGIYLSQIWGYSDDNANQRWIAEVGPVTDRAAQRKEGYCVIEDYTWHTGATTASKMRYIKFMLSRPNLKKVIFCNASHVFALTIRIARRMYKTPFDVIIARDYQDALRIAGAPATDPQSTQGPQSVLNRNGFTMQASLRYPDYLHIIAQGTMREEHIDDVLSLYRTTLAGLPPQHTSCVLLLDAGGIKWVTWKARGLYLNEMEKLNKEILCRCVYVYNLNTFIRMLISVSRPVSPVAIQAVRSIDVAIAHAEKMRKRHSVEAQTTLSRRKLAPHDIQDLLAYIGNIEWGQINSAPETEIPPQDHPLRPVYESFMIIKNDFNVLLDEKETAEKWLRSSYKELELRVERRTAQLNTVNAALQGARTTAEEANLAKSRFLANMGHEIRTPLNAIIGFAQIMSRTDPGPDHQKHAQIILSESRRLLELINQVLDISKIEAGKMELHPSVFDINELLDELQRAFALQAGQKGLKFIIEKGDDLPRAVIGDLLKVRQVLVNLLGNAFKFTERGQVTLSILRIHNAQADSPVLIRFQVSDTGPGIQPDRIGKIFQRFEQVDYSLSRKAGGTGLGTSISKQLVTLMGGTVGVESVYGSGSTFWAEIPFEETAQIPDNTVEALLPAVSLHGKHILLVEDYEPNQQVAQLHLNAADVTLTIASNGLDAVSFAQEKKFDCILMDVQMPVMDGLEATASIRGLPGPNAAIPIIGMTAFVYDTDRAKCFAAGMSEVLPKPVEWDIALVKISAWIQNRSMWPRESPAPAALAAPVAQNAKVPLHKQPSGTAVLDWERYVTRMRGNVDMALTIVNGFMEQLPTTLAELSAAQTAKDRETVIRLVHSVKGAALNICADSLAATAKDLEIYLREHESGGEEELMKEFLKKCGELQTWVLDFTQKEIKK